MLGLEIPTLKSHKVHCMILVIICQHNYLSIQLVSGFLVEEEGRTTYADLNLSRKNVIKCNRYIKVSILCLSIDLGYILVFSIKEQPMGWIISTLGFSTCTEICPSMDRLKSTTSVGQIFRNAYQAFASIIKGKIAICFPKTPSPRYIRYVYII